MWDRSNAMRGPRFEQTVFELQPQPLAAIELIAEEPIRLVPTRIAACDGGKSGSLTTSVESSGSERGARAEGC